MCLANPAGADNQKTGFVKRILTGPSLNLHLHSSKRIAAPGLVGGKIASRITGRNAGSGKIMFSLNLQKAVAARHPPVAAGRDVLPSAAAADGAALSGINRSRCCIFLHSIPSNFPTA